MSRRIIGLGTTRVTTANPGFQLVAQSIARPPGFAGISTASGVARIWWRIASVITPPPRGSVPRIRIGWQVHEDTARGNLLNIPTPAPAGFFDPDSANQEPSLLCDAWYGSIEVQGTSFGVTAGFGGDDTAGGDFVVQATITEEGTGAEQIATYSRHVSFTGIDVDVYIPGATGTTNNGAHRARAVEWYSDTALDVTLTVQDFAGTTISLVRTGAAAAPAPYIPVSILLHPSAYRIRVGAGAAVNGYLLFRYF